MNTFQHSQQFGINKSYLSRNSLRQSMTLLHRYAGLFLAAFLIIAGITGTAIAYYRELDRTLNPDLYRIVERGQPPLSIDALAAKIQRENPHAFINLMTLDRKRGESVRIVLSPRTDPDTGNPYSLERNELFIDPFDGKILGGREYGAFHADRAHLMPFIYRVHYTLYLPGSWGVWLMGIVALIWMFDCCVGFYLTLPRSNAKSISQNLRKNWWQRWKPAWKIKRARLNFDMHRAGGLWFWVILFMLGMTGVYFNLKQEVFLPALRSMATVTPETTAVLTNLPQAFAPATLSFEEAIARAQLLRSPATKNMVLSYAGLTPDAPGFYRVRFADVERGDASWHFRYENLFIDGATGELAWRVSYFSGTAADQFILWQYPLHSGQLFGFWGRTLIAITGLVTALLSITGIIIWYRKRRARYTLKRS